MQYPETISESNSTIFKEHAMLVLSRKKQQTVIIDGQVEIEVLAIKGNAVRLGITAPNTVKIIRGELSPFELQINIPEDTSDDVGAYQ
jgi:carbon storage regulator CsrA